jgi:hypothetical protein
MINHRDHYNQMKTLVITHNFNLIDIKAVNDEN